MRTRTLGQQRLTVSAIGLGCMGMSQAYGPAHDKESIATVRRAIEVGVTLLDTAMTYGAGHNEELIGRAITGRRDQVVLASKVGIAVGDCTTTPTARSPWMRSTRRSTPSSASTLR